MFTIDIMELVSSLSLTYLVVAACAGKQTSWLEVPLTSVKKTSTVGSKMEAQVPFKKLGKVLGEKTIAALLYIYYIILYYVILYYILLYYNLYSYTIIRIPKYCEQILWRCIWECRTLWNHLLVHRNNIWTRLSRRHLWAELRDISWFQVKFHVSWLRKVLPIWKLRSEKRNPESLNPFLLLDAVWFCIEIHIITKGEFRNSFQNIWQHFKKVNLKKNNSWTDKVKPAIV